MRSWHRSGGRLLVKPGRVRTEAVRDVRDIEAARLVPSIIGEGCGDFLSNHAALSWWKSGWPCRRDLADLARDAAPFREGALKLACNNR